MKAAIAILLLCASTFPLAAQQYRVIDARDSINAIMLEPAVVIQARAGQADSQVAFMLSGEPGNLEAMLERLPGVSMIGRGPYGREVVIRGMTEGRIRTTVDGMAIYGACTDKMDPVSSYVETANLQAAELPEGAGGLGHGSSIGGGLNLQTLDPGFSQSPKWSSNWRNHYHSISRGGSSSLHLTRIGKQLSTAATATLRSHGNYSDGQGETVPYSQYHKANVSLTTKWMPAKNHLVKADLIVDEAWDMGYPALPMDVAYARALIGGLTYTRYHERKHWERTRVKAYANRIAHAMDDSQRPDVPIRMDMPGWSRTTGILAEQGIHLGGCHRLQLKADIHRNFSRAEMAMFADGETPMFMLTWPDAVRWVTGLFAQYSYIHNNHNLKIEGRFDRLQSELAEGFGRKQWEVFANGDFHRAVHPLAGANARYRFQVRSWAFDASAGYAERGPTLSELYGFYLFNARDGFDYLGNPGIAKERALQGAAGITLEQKSFRIGLKGFTYRFLDYILADVDPNLSAMTPGANGVKVYESLPTATMAGAGLTLEWKVTKQLGLHLNADYTTGFDHVGSPLPLIPPLSGLSIFRYSKAGWWVQAEHQWAARQSRVRPDFGETESPGFSVWNARANIPQKAFGQQWELYLALENIANAVYYHHLDWVPVHRLAGICAWDWSGGFDFSAQRVCCMQRRGGAVSILHAESRRRRDIGSIVIVRSSEATDREG
jgi:iron complex outermembrane recepter protein